MNSAQSDLLRTEYVILVSNDGQEFYLDRKITSLSDVLYNALRTAPLDKKYRKITLDHIKGSVLEIVIQYLHFKSRYMYTDFEHNPPPPFEIEPILALDVLKAAISLRI